MKSMNDPNSSSTEAFPIKEMDESTTHENEIAEAYAELERGMLAALETYSNVHRGSGHNSMVTTHLYELAREIILEYLGLDKGRYMVVFCTAGRAAAFVAQLEQGSFRTLSSGDFGLSLGVRAVAVKRNALPKDAPFQSGGGTTKLVSKNWVIWADAPAKFEAGTPAIINVIAFAMALRMISSGKNFLPDTFAERLTASQILYHDELEKYSGQELLIELRKTLIGRGVLVPTMEGMRPFINMDNSASTPTFTPVWNAFRQAYRQPGEVKQEIIREVKSICAEALGAHLAAYDVIFTSNTTEAINLTAMSMSRESSKGTKPVVLNTLIEHSSNDLPWRFVPGCTVTRLQVDDEGFVDLDELDILLQSYNKEGKYGKKRIRLVAVSGASNVLGICNNIWEISRIVHRYGVRLLVDGAQMAAHRMADLEGCDIDYFAFSAHKVYAPFGCGVLMSKKGMLNFNSAEWQSIHLSGEENVGGIAALGKALVLIKRIGADLVTEEEQELTARALRGMARIPGLRLFGVIDPDSPNFYYKIGVIVFSMKGIIPPRLAKEIAMYSGIGVRYGCHCAHLAIKRLLNTSPSLERFQWLLQTLFPALSLPGLARVSLGIENTKEDVDALLQVLGKIAGKHKTSRNKHSTSAPGGTPVLSRADVNQQMNDFIKAVALRVYS